MMPPHSSIPLLPSILTGSSKAKNLHGQTPHILFPHVSSQFTKSLHPCEGRIRSSTVLSLTSESGASTAWVP